MIIYKYEIQLKAQEFVLPKGAKILAVQTQHGTPQIWILLNPEAKTEKRRFLVYPTGYPFEIELNKKLIHIGTFQLDGGYLVFHLFEEVEK